MFDGVLGAIAAMAAKQVFPWQFLFPSRQAVRAEAKYLCQGMSFLAFLFEPLRCLEDMHGGRLLADGMSW